MSFEGTTILAVRKGNQVAVAGDGQVTFGDTVLKGNSRKVRRMYSDRIIAGFAGSTADAFTLFELIEKKLSEYNGDLTRAAVELAKEWRTDRMLRKLEAMLLVADAEHTFLISGNGDVVQPEHDSIAIGSGGSYAYAASRAFLEASDYSAAEIARRSLLIASEICIYTNSNIIVEELS